MAYDKVVDSAQLEADLTSVADSIRIKTGSDEKLAFPSGFVNAVNSIETGGGADEALAEVEYKLSNGYTNYSYMFFSKNLSEMPNEIIRHIENGTNFTYFCYGNPLTELPVLNTKNGENFERCFSSCSFLVTMAGIDISNATSVSSMFLGCVALEHITFNGVIKKSGLDLSSCSKLTHDSLMSAINALFDHATAGTSGTFKLTLGSTNLAKLTDAEKAIATQKGFTLA